MASVYIIFSDSLRKFYIGYTTDTIEIRLEKHNNKFYQNKYTANGIPWVLFLEIKCVSTKHAIKVEKSIKSMKSKIYIQNLKKYPEMVIKLKEKCLL
jgi:putative endonuclease